MNNYVKIYINVVLSTMPRTRKLIDEAIWLTHGSYLVTFGICLEAFLHLSHSLNFTLRSEFELGHCLNISHSEIFMCKVTVRL